MRNGSSWPGTTTSASDRMRWRLAASAAAGLPEWDPATEIIAIFSEGVGSSCPEVRIDAVTFDGEDGLVFPTLSDPLSPRACTSDLRGGQTFVVALARDSLPGHQFTLILEPDLPHLGELQVTLE